MAMFPCITGIPTKLYNAMQSVLNKKMETTGQDYPSQEWPDEVNLLGKLPEKIASGSLVSFDDGADTVPLKEGTFEIVPKQASGTPSPSNPIPIYGASEMNIGQDSKYGDFVDFNQLASLNASDWTLSNASISSSGTTITFAPTSSGNAIKFAYFKLTHGHTYMIYSGTVDTTHLSGASLFYGIWRGTTGNTYQVREFVQSGGTGNLSAIWKVTSATTYTWYFRFQVGTAATDSMYTTIESPIIIDLTQMFGETKANEILAMETATAGSGIAYVKSLLYKDYYTYTKGGMLTTIDAVNGDAAQAERVHNLWFGLGKNLFDSKLYLSDYHVSQNGSFSANENYNIYSLHISYGNSYMVSLVDSDTSANKSCRVVTHDADGNIVEVFDGAYTSGTHSFPVVPTLPFSSAYIGFRKTTTNQQVEVGDTATTYEPFHFVYGGNFDSVSGVLKETFNSVNLEDLTWTTRYTGSTNKTISTTLSVTYPKISNPKMIAEKYLYIDSVNAASALNAPDSKSVGIYSYYNSSSSLVSFQSIYIVLPISESPSGKLVYKTAEIEYVEKQLQPVDIETIDGQNYIWCDTGDSSVTYRAQIQSSTLGTKTITTNGTYNASDDNLDGFSSVVVNTNEIPSGNHSDPMNALSATNISVEATESAYYIKNGALEVIDSFTFDNATASRNTGICFDLSKFGLESGKSYTITFVFDLKGSATPTSNTNWGCAYSSTQIPSDNASFNITPDVYFQRQTGQQNVTMNFTASTNNYLVILLNMGGYVYGVEAVIRDVNITEIV